MNDFFRELCCWFLENKRDFPWRKNPTFYSVWVSEVMLQQTRAEVVVPFYLKWMEEFPDIYSLAKASADQVIKCWEGLGYYSRARNLHQGAKQIISLYGNKDPDTEEQLLRIKGLGPYSVGAILSFAFHKRAIAIDGNVLRVMSRLFLIQESIDKVGTKKQIAKLVEQHQSHEKSWIFNEALIELGALVCQKTPKCSLCPLKKKCAAFEQGLAEVLPFKEKKTTYIKEKKVILLLEYKGSFLVKKNREGLMKDLYEFPYVPLEKLSESLVDEELIQGFVKKIFGLEVTFLKELASEFHSYTKYRSQLFPYLFSVLKGGEVPGYTWYPKDLLGEIPFSAGHRRLKERLV